MAVTPPPSITPAPTPAPQRNDRTTFSGRVDAFITWLTTAVSQFAALATNVQNNATDAATSATTATTQAANATVAANSATATANATAWVSGTTYALNVNAISQIDFQTYRRKVAGAGATDPKNDLTNWALVTAPPQVIRQARTSNTILGNSDRANLIDITSGTFTQTFDAAATLGSGWYCWLRNSSAGDITLDPNAAETIDGLTSFVMYPGEARLVQCDGTALTSVVVNPFSRVFTSTGTFTKPPGYSQYGGLIWSAGNSGQRTNSATTASAGGGGGGCFPFTLAATALAATETITIGAGGLAVTTVATGNVGGTSSIGTLISCYGGSPSYCGGSVTSGLKAGVTGMASAFGFEGGNGLQTLSAAIIGIWGGGAAYDFAVGASGGSLYGGAAGGGVNASAVVQAPGASKFGGNGGAASSAGNGTDGVAPGGGGGATQTGTQSGAGARGELRIWGTV